MAARKPAPTVTLSHPSGKFTVTVTPQRAAVLEERGYVLTETAPRSSARKGKAAAESQES